MIHSPWFLMAVMSFFLGIRHGFDLDHLATIDAIARSYKHKNSYNKWVGCLFSLGHGLVITLVSVAIGSELIQNKTPKWLEGVGSIVSLCFLILFGILSLYSVCFQKDGSGLPQGIKALIAKKIAAKATSATSVIVIGALFALSFDTISQVALFSFSASILSGWEFALLLGILFTLGMMISDGLNGLIISFIIQRVDRASVIISKGLGMAISLFSFTIAAISLMNILSK